MTALILSALLQGEENWPQFRGPAGDGHSSAVGIAREWSENKNVVWKTAIHDKGWSSPVVWGKQIWLTTGKADGKQLVAICVDRESGKILIDLKLFDIPTNPDANTPKYNSFASPTPVIEEGFVYAHFGTHGTACLSTRTGQVVWARRDLLCDHWRGAGSSPILFQNLLILTFDGYDRQFVTALDKKTGKTIWKTDRAHDYGTNDGDLKKGFATPTVIQAGSQFQLVSPAAKGALSYDPMTGKEFWRVQWPAHSVAARPLFAFGLVFLGTGQSKPELLAIRPDGTGNISNSHVAWKSADSIGRKTSPILVGDLIYTVQDAPATVSCLEAKTGKQVWKQRIGQSAEYSASPVYADGALYFCDHDGKTVVLKAGRTYEVLAENKLDGGFRASPAIVWKSIFLRTETHLYRIESR